MRRFVAQSFAAWLYERVGGPVKTEEDPLDPNPIRPIRETFGAIRYVENAVTGADWTVGNRPSLRRVLRPRDEPVDRRRASRADPAAEVPDRRRWRGVWSFIHIEDAADATLAAVEGGERGVYNVVDDSPERVRDWLPGMAGMIGAPAPRRVPKWLGRLFAGQPGVIMMTELRGQSNAKAKRELGWTPRHPNWRDGFAELAADAEGPAAADDRRAVERVNESTDQLLEELRPRAFAIAYRMLGSVAEAEDIVQEALIRVNNALEEGETIESPRAYVATITTRLAIDELRSARARRETYVGEWLPEPVVVDTREDPERQAEMADSLSLAFLVLLENLSPEQRAALLLHDVFDYDYSEIAQIIGKSEDNARQLATRARSHVDQGKPRFEASKEKREELAGSVLRGGTGGEHGNPGSPAVGGRRPQGRRRRQGAGDCTVAARPQPGRPHAPRLVEDRLADPEPHRPARGDQWPVRRPLPRRRGRRDRRRWCSTSPRVRSRASTPSSTRTSSSTSAMSAMPGLCSGR